jgi:hypothetical protein
VADVGQKTGFVLAPRRAAGDLFQDGGAQRVNALAGDG